VILWYGPHAVGSLPLASLLVMWLLRFIRMSRLLVRTYTRALTSLYNTVDYLLHPCSSHWLAIILAKFVARRANRGWTSVLAIAREAFSRLSCSRSSHLSALLPLCCAVFAICATRLYSLRSNDIFHHTFKHAS
jgi:hypothetical protein